MNRDAPAIHFLNLDNLAEKRRPQVESARLPEEKQQVGGKAQNFSWSALAVALTCRNRALEKKFALTYSGDTALIWSRTTWATTR